MKRSKVWMLASILALGGMSMSTVGTPLLTVQAAEEATVAAKEYTTQGGIANMGSVLWSSIFVTLMANKIGGLQFGIYRNCQISSRVFHTAVAALPLTKANRSDFE